MNVTLTPEQRLLSETAAQIADKVATVNPSEAELDLTLSAEVIDEQWRRVVELGLPSLRIPDALGPEGSGVETALCLEQFARTLAAVPVVGQAAIVPELLAAASALDLLDAVAEGSRRLAPVLASDLQDFAGIESGAVCFDASGATEALAVERDGDLHRLVSLPLNGEPLPALDLTTSLVELSVGEPVQVGEAIDRDRWDRAHALALTAVAADLLGVMQGALDDAVSYVGGRVQFGVPVGTFQAVQHLLADALVRVEGTRSCVWHAAWAVDQLPPRQALLAARSAKAYAAAAGRDVVEASVQAFGGIAITWGHVSHVRLRRTLLDRRLLGDEIAQYDQIARLRLQDPEVA
ncbi:acyl-CoA dehydrogenase [Mycobacterium paraterrae]|uniref:Acyl-CoA dehydrogenase family protein n=1 Tax=Mycobacterium paraterrae TaxID=577492 RepID=A0ABY3VJV1_9MYCO|nr:acyl-CoA dehydrogenase [Mycobacterium paraterrae]UMB69689.1 acyl-CoA dehydrogenase family protein [Mycobacterium paraterrae]